MDRTRSHSRFPAPTQSSIPEVFPSSTLDRNQRSKSLDNRRAFISPQANDTYNYQNQNRGASFVDQTYTPTMGRRRYYGNNNSNVNSGIGKDNFFNDAITIPIQKEQPRHYKSAVDVTQRNQGNEDMEDLWTSYDKTVRYNHDRINYPVKNLPTSQYNYDGYAREHAPIAYTESRPSDYGPQPQQISNSAYNSRAGGTTFAEGYRSGSTQQHHHDANYRAGTHENYKSTGGGHYQDNVSARPPYDEEYVGDSTFDGRTLGESADARQQQKAYQYSKHHESSAAARSGRQQQKQATGNGYSHHSYHRRHASAGGGTGGHASGFWSGSKSYGYGPPSNMGGPKHITHHRVRCCCLNFMWPPWGYERCDPPQPIFYTPPSSGGTHHHVRTTQSRSGQTMLPPLQPINTSNLPPPQANTQPHYPHSPSRY